MELHLVKKKNITVSGVIVFYYGMTACYAYAACVQNNFHIRQGINQLAMWSALRQALHRGAAVFDFGTSAKHHESLWRYKERWGGVSSPFRKTLVGVSPEKAGLSQDSWKVRAASPLLRRLPQGVFDTCSPLLLKTVA